MGKIIDGKAAASAVRARVKSEVENIIAAGGRKPCLAVVIVGDDPASRIYVRNKVAAAREAGMESRLEDLPASVSQDELISLVNGLNADPAVDGVLVQLPLPSHIDENIIIDTIAPSKDVDGFHPLNVAALQLGRECILPCTPAGIIHLLDREGVQIEGKRAVVIGRSNIVGKPVAKLLLDRHATVTLCHSRTRDLGSVTREADILVTAVGHAGLISADMIKEGAVILDVGMNRSADGHLCGDVDFEGCIGKASLITPVPGGVGPMTIAMLLQNTLKCYKHHVEGA